jgi:hypothetical protein
MLLLSSICSVQLLCRLLCCCCVLGFVQHVITMAAGCNMYLDQRNALGIGTQTSCSMFCATRIAQLPPAGCCILAAWGLCIAQNSQAELQPVSLTDLTHISTDTQMSTDMPASRVVMQVGCCCPLPSAVVVFVAVCTGFVQHVTAARQVQPGLFDRLDASQQIHNAADIPCISRAGHARSDAAVLCHLHCCVVVHRGFATCHCNDRYSLVSLTDLTHPNRCTDVWYALVSFRSYKSMRLSAAICRLFVLFAACTGFVQHVNTGGYRLQGLLHRSTQNNRARNWRVELILCRCCCLRAVLF